MKVSLATTSSQIALFLPFYTFSNESSIAPLHFGLIDIRVDAGDALADLR
jgi:hypothetical protein